MKTIKGFLRRLFLGDIESRIDRLEQRAASKDAVIALADATGYEIWAEDGKVMARPKK